MASARVVGLLQALDLFLLIMWQKSVKVMVEWKSSPKALYSLKRHSWVLLVLLVLEALQLDYLRIEAW